jgi:hypothetical protein
MVFGASGDGASSTELLVISRKTMMKRYLGRLLVGHAGWAMAAGLRPCKFFNIFSDSFPFSFSAI